MNLHCTSLCYLCVCVTCDSYSLSLRLATSLLMMVPMYSMTMVHFSMSLAAYRPRPCRHTHRQSDNDQSVSERCSVCAPRVSPGCENGPGTRCSSTPPSCVGTGMTWSGVPDELRPRTRLETVRWRQERGQRWSLLSPDTWELCWSAGTVWGPDRHSVSLTVQIHYMQMFCWLHSSVSTVFSSLGSPKNTISYLLTFYKIRSGLNDPFLMFVSFSQNNTPPPAQLPERFYVEHIHMNMKQQE